MSSIKILPAETSDLVAIAAIYAHSVHTSTATFDDQEPPLSLWQAKLDSTATGDHFLVARGPRAPDLGAGDDDAVLGDAVLGDAVLGDAVLGDAVLGDAVLGYAYSAAFRSRPAYNRTRETSVYVAPDAQGRGVGGLLYAELIHLLRQDEIHLAVAIVTQPNPVSDAIHRKLGFTNVGTLDEVGFKFGAYVSTTTYQLRLD